MSPAFTSDNDYKSIAEFYSGKTIFITGGTGFIGKVLLEKLLYSCPNVGKIYMLIRESEDTSAPKRLQKILDIPVFNRIKAEKPQDLDKLVAVAGDMTKDDLGISEEDKQILLKEISIVFHCAATVKFNEPLAKALQINVEGTRNILNFSKSMKNIQVFSYLSTIFSTTGTGSSNIEEKLYNAPYTLDEIKKLSKEVEENEKLLNVILGGFPNTYTLTKSIAENVVATEHGDIPTVIVRPSVVTPAEKDPLSGWIDNWYGPTAILSLHAKGFVRAMYGNNEYPFEIIPVEYVTNLMIVSAAKLKKQQEVEVFHSCSSGSNPIKLKDVSRLYLREGRKNKFNELPQTPMIFMKSVWILAILSFLLHTVPAFIGDLCLLLLGKPRRHMKVMRKVSSYLKIIEHFSSRCWSMSTTRCEKLHASLSEVDRNTFPCDPKLLQWDNYFAIYFQGVQTYLIK